MSKQVLLVDDSKSARIVLSRLLKKNGFDSVEMAESGEQAIEILQDMTPDAIFVDYQMGGMDGLETISAIKQDSRFQSTPVVMCTANEGDHYLNSAIDRGALGIIAKPPQEESLKAVLEQIEEEIAKAPVDDFASSAAASSVAISSASQLSPDELKAVAREAASELLDESLDNRVMELMDQRMHLVDQQPDASSLTKIVSAQVVGELETTIKTINQETLDAQIETAILEKMQELTKALKVQLKTIREELEAKIPKEQEMIEDLRQVTDGAVDARIQELASMVARDIARTSAIEAAEQVVQDHLAEQALTKAANESSLNKLLIWLGAGLLVATTTVLALHLLGIII